MIGTTISHYKILEEISRGGMGIVYRARDVKLNREVAIKVLPPDLVVDPERKRRFVQEAQAAAALHHPHIAVIHEIDEVDGVTFIAMELIDGKKLSDALARDRLPLARSLDLATEVAEGLSRAHSKGIVHRDLKPANIMVTEDGHAKVIDFGLAKLVEPLASGDSQAHTALRGETDPGKVMGTVSYMSPEQARGVEVDHRTDVFALGVVLYQMLSGQLPFRGATAADTQSAILTKPVPQVPFLGEGVSSEASSDLQRLIDKCLAKDPTARYQGIKDLIVDLRAARRRLETGSVSAVVAPATTRPTKRAHLVLAGLGLLALVAASIFFFRESPPEERPADDRKRIVVLPFENLGPPEDAYFAAGMTEEITSRLAVVSGLGVISRNSAVQYEKSGKTTKEIGEDLGVDYILEGSVRWQKGEEGSSRVRVTPQLIRVSDDTHVWAERYDQVVDDIFQVQSDIAQNVIQELDIALLGRESEAIEASPTDNLEAYQAYLRGLEHAEGPDSDLESTVRLTIEMFERAVELDPRFALAYSRLSMAHSSFFHLGYDRTEERLAKAMEAVNQALSLQRDLPEAHLALGYYSYWGKREYDRALQELAIAEKGLPNNSLIFEAIGYIRRRQGHFEESLENIEKAIQLNPLKTSLLQEQAGTYGALRRYEEAERYYDLAISAAPDAVGAYLYKAQMEWFWNGKVKQARATLEAMPSTDDPWAAETWFWQELMERNYEQALERLSSVSVESFVGAWGFTPRSLYKAYAYQLLDKPELARAGFEEARIFLERELEKRPDDHWLHSALGIAYAGLGRKEEAIREGKLATELYPISLDAFEGPLLIMGLALIYTMVGEHDSALDQIDHSLSIPGGFSVGWLELDPSWDPLRNHPRYQEIVEKYSPPTSGTN
jgi:TolB-like protein/Flp pilus assembly protein TadD/predicted Ser/Thr protein kinase